MDVRSENASVLLLGTWTNNIFIMSFNLGNFRRRSTDLLPHLTMAEKEFPERNRNTTLLVERSKWKRSYNVAQKCL